VSSALKALARPVRLLAAGGTISMEGERAVPSLDAQGLVEAVPALAAMSGLEIETLLAVPSVHLSLAQALELAQQATAAASEGAGVVLTTGTDTLEEIAALCAFLHDSEAPIVITGANRPATGPGADGPANLLDAVAVAGAPAASGLGVAVVFAGEIHAALAVRKVDSTGPTAFGSPLTGPLGRVVEGHAWVHARPLRPPRLEVSELAHRVEIVTPALGDDGALLRQAAVSADGVVLVALGAGHVSPPVLSAVRAAAEHVRFLVTCRPDRSAMLVETYGFEGSEADLRASDVICVPFLAPPAARIALLCCLGAGLDRERTREALAPWDVV
jgi:L-asparaginase